MELDNTSQFMVMALMLAGLVAVVARPVMTLVVPATVLLFGALLLCIDRNTVPMKRMCNAAVSPIMSWSAPHNQTRAVLPNAPPPPLRRPRAPVAPGVRAVHTMRGGAPVIRAMDFGEFFARRAAVHVEEWARLIYAQKALQTWGQHCSGHVTFALGGATSFYLVATRETRDKETAALTCTYAFMLPYFVGTIAMFVPQLRTYVACLERVLEYLHLPQEAAREVAADPPAGKWPHAGAAIEFRALSMRYRPGLPLALKDFSATVGARQKAGIVGRTGAGKSTLILALFRLVEPASGDVLIDGVGVRGLGLARLRSAITIIPQDPVLHAGSVAHNMDPLGATGAAELEAALERAGLPASLLVEEVQKGGANLSSGQRQQLCFARALLHPRPILVLDEATSNLDAQSDAAIQALLRGEFGTRQVTVLTVAHRLQTVADYDTILVVGDGRLVEQA